MFGALLEVELSKVDAVVRRSAFPLLGSKMSKKCTRMWREARFKVTMAKHHMFGPILHAQAGFFVAGAMDSVPCQK